PPAAPGGLLEEALDIDGVRAALESMEQDHARRSRDAVQVVQDQLVAIRSLEELPLQDDQPAVAGHPPPDGLEMRPGQPPGRHERRFGTSVHGFRFTVHESQSPSRRTNRPKRGTNRNLTPRIP